MMKPVFILVILLHGLHVIAQNSFVDQHLLSAQDDSRLSRYSEELSFLDKGDIKSSWIREVEIRGRSDRFSEPLSDYRLRLSPANPWEVKANKDYADQLNQTTRISYQLTFTKVIKDRYEQLIESYFLNARTQLLKQMVDIRQVQNTQRLERINELTIDDLLEAESELSELEIELAETHLDLREINQTIALFTKSPVTWTNWTMIHPEQIMGILNSRDTSNHSNLYKQSSLEKLALEEQMLNVSKKEAFSNIGFIQADMDLDQGDRFNEHLGFQIGVSIPIVNKDKADLARDRFDLIEKRNEVSLVNEEINQELQSLMTQITSLNEIHLLVTDKISRAQKLAENISTATDPNTMIKYQHYKLDLIWKKTQVEENLIRRFIDYLELEGLLAKSPLTNYLSTDLMPLQQTNTK